MFALYFSITDSLALHSSESDHSIISYHKPFSVAAAWRTTAILFLITFEVEGKM